MRLSVPPPLPPVPDTPRVTAAIRWCVAAQVKRPAAVRWLLGVLAHTEDARVRNQAALALSDLGVQAAVPILVGLLSAEVTARSRGSLLYALQELDYRDHLAALAEQFGSEVYEVLEMALQLFEQLPRRVSQRQMRPALERLAHWAQTVTDPDRAPYPRQALRLLQAVATASAVHKSSPR
jgi:HEAT repeats